MLVTRDGDHKISVLSVDGNKVEDTKRLMTGGFRPLAIQISPEGDIAVVTDQGGDTGDIDTINVIDLAGKAPRVVNTLDVGQSVEGVASPMTGPTSPSPRRTDRPGRRAIPSTMTAACSSCSG